MEEERFVSSRENPRNLGFLPERCASGSSNNNKGIPNDPIQKPPPPILDRFRALLKDREEEMRVSDDEDVPAPSTEEIVRIYEDVLSELTFNSKPIITELTIIAGEQREYAEGIADAICARIMEAPVEQKLPSLYLLDSVVKNIGRVYVRYFASRLPEVFCEAYRQVHPNLHPAMRHLFGTWSAVFPPSVLHKIETELQFSAPVNHQSSGLAALKSSESPSPRPTHGIHVNPKYLEARRQFEHSAVMHETDPNDDAAHMPTFGGEIMGRSALTNPTGWSGASSKFHEVQHAGRISSSLQIHGQKPAIGYREYDSDHSNVLGAQRLGSPGGASHSSSVGGVERLLPSSKNRLPRSSSPSRIGRARSSSPNVDGFATDNSPRRVVERASPSHSGLESGLVRVTDGDGERSDWWTKQWSNDNRQQLETSGGCSLSNGFDQQRPRALIDAYGNYGGKNTLNEKPLKVERLDVNGINSSESTRKWQNTEEEEYVWEDMSPTLKRPGAAAFLERDFKRGNWPSQGQLSVVEDSAIVADDGVSVLGSGRGSIGMKALSGSGTRNGSTQIQGFRYPQESWGLSHYFPQSSQRHLDPNARGRAGQMYFPGSGMSHQIDNFSDTDAPFQRFSGVMSRMGSSKPDSLNMEVPLPMTSVSTREKHVGQRPHSAPLAPLMWPPVSGHKSRPRSLLPILPQQKQIQIPLDILDANKSVVNQAPNTSSFLPGQRIDAPEMNALTSSKLMNLPNQQVGLISLNQQSQGTLQQRQLIQSQDTRENFVPTAAAQISSHLIAQSLNPGYMPEGQGALRSSILPNPIPGIPSSSVTIPGTSNTSFHLQGRTLPPLPPGPPPASSQMGPISQNLGPVASHPPTGSAFSGLISSLMAQGLISLTTPTSVQDSVGVEFNLDLLKVRYESAINALYAELPRQCTTCGQRFKSQEEHSSHMDWHVTKNRISKVRKQKPSRKWFLSTSVWLSGAEALGTDAAPGFLPTEVVVEKKDDEELAVPADENQNVCALCGEPFDDFYSDETEEWMYKGAVYLNAPDGSTAGMDRAQLGPIVHAKCRSESTVVSPEDFGLEGGEEGSQRKRMRS